MLHRFHFCNITNFGNLIFVSRRLCLYHLLLHLCYLMNFRGTFNASTLLFLCKVGSSNYIALVLNF